MALFVLLLLLAPGLAEAQLNGRPRATTVTQVCDRNVTVVAGMSFTLNVRDDAQQTCQGSYGTYEPRYITGYLQENTSDGGNSDALTTFGTARAVYPGETNPSFWQSDFNRTDSTAFDFTYTSRSGTGGNTDTFVVRMEDESGPIRYVYYHVTITGPAPTVSSIAPTGGSTGGGTPVTMPRRR